MSKDLHLILTHRWYERYLVDKSEDYREMTPYWAKRLCNNFNLNHQQCKYACCNTCAQFTARQYQNIVLRKGYTPTQIIKKHIDTVIDFGNQNWGASDNVQFIIKLK